MQMIVERLFTRKSEVRIPSYDVPSREFSAIEENAIYYTAGYVVRKILCRHVKKDDAKSKSIVTALISMLGNHYDNDIVEELSSYMDYVTTWTRIADHGGLTHVTLDTFCFFSTAEVITGDLLSKGCNKIEVTGQAFVNEAVRFHWDLISRMRQTHYSCYEKQSTCGIQLEVFLLLANFLKTTRKL